MLLGVVRWPELAPTLALEVCRLLDDEVGRERRELSRSASVPHWALRAERGLWALMMIADQVVWHYDERPAGPMARTRRRRAVQTTLE